MTQRMKDGEMKPDLLISYNTTQYYFYDNGRTIDESRILKEEKQELYFNSTKQGETFYETLDAFSNELTFNQPNTYPHQTKWTSERL